MKLPWYSLHPCQTAMLMSMLMRAGACEDPARHPALAGNLTRLALQSPYRGTVSEVVCKDPDCDKGHGAGSIQCRKRAYQYLVAWLSIIQPAVGLPGFTVEKYNALVNAVS